MHALLDLFALLPGWLDPEKLLAGGYILLFAVIFAESGLLAGFFLPGDSLLFTAGLLSNADNELVQKVLDGKPFNVFIVAIGCVLAAVVGDQVGYLIGNRAGPTLFRRPDSRLFKQEYVGKAEEFFADHGPRALVLARFVPIIRTFVPTVAGVSRMEYRTFVRYNVIGGTAWGAGLTVLGYFLGNVGVIRDHLEISLLAIVAISLIPAALEFVKHRRARADRAS